MRAVGCAEDPSPGDDMPKTQHDVPRAARTPHLLDLDMSARGGALPAGDDELPQETPDTQESLGAEDDAYRIDEVEGDGRRRAGNRIVRHTANGPPMTLVAG